MNLKQSHKELDENLCDFSSPIFPISWWRVARDLGKISEFKSLIYFKNPSLNLMLVMMTWIIFKSLPQSSLSFKFTRLKNQKLSLREKLEQFQTTLPKRHEGGNSVLAFILPVFNAENSVATEN